MVFPRLQTISDGSLQTTYVQHMITQRGFDNKLLLGKRMMTSCFFGERTYFFEIVVGENEERL